MHSDDEFTIIVKEKSMIPYFGSGSAQIRITGRFTHYEETHDGTESGLYKFKKDIAAAIGYTPKDEYELELSSDESNWTKVIDGLTLDAGLAPARKTRKLFVRVFKKGGFPYFLSGVLIGTIAVGTALIMIRKK